MYTYEGSPVVMIYWGDDSESPVYNRKATFADGVADGIEFEAWKKDEEEEEVTLAVTIVSDEWGSVPGEVKISVEAGDPETLDAVKDGRNIQIYVKDKMGQVVDRFEPEQAKVQLRVKPEVGESSVLAQSEAPPPSAKPGVDGVAYVKFVKGSATIELVDSTYYKEKLALEYEEEEDKVVTLIVKLVDYDLETEIEWTRAIVSDSDPIVLEDIVVPVGTSFDDLPLRSTVQVVLDDGEEVEVPVDWTDAAEDYDEDAEDAGEYLLKGVLVPGEGITNPDNITVQVTGVVQDNEGGVEGFDLAANSRSS